MVQIGQLHNAVKGSSAQPALPTATIKVTYPDGNSVLIMNGVPLTILTASSAYFTDRIAQETKKSSTVPSILELEVPAADITPEALRRWILWIRELKLPFPSTYRGQPQLPLKDGDTISDLATLYRKSDNVSPPPTI